MLEIDENRLHQWLEEGENHVDFYVFQSANPFICSELFTIGKSIHFLIIHANLFMPSMLYIKI